MVKRRISQHCGVKFAVRNHPNKIEIIEQPEEQKFVKD